MKDFGQQRPQVSVRTKLDNFVDRTIFDLLQLYLYRAWVCSVFDFVVSSAVS